MSDLNVNTINIDPVVTSRLLMSTSVGIFRSEDSGVSWTKTSTMSGTFDFVYDLDNTSNVFTPVSKSNDGGQTWTAMSTPAGAQAAIAVDGSRNELYAAGSTGIYRSADDGVTWTQVLNASNCTSLAVLPNLPAPGRAAQGVGRSVRQRGGHREDGKIVPSVASSRARVVR
jgi:photosystem II stability/assembly factor-like uncharacterized protein